MQGLHLTADLHHCRCDSHWLTDAGQLGEFCLRVVRQAGLTPVGQLFHRFADTAAGPGGVTATVLLAESHLCIHTWPELRAVTLDVYVCNFGAVDASRRARRLMQLLQAQFAAEKADCQELQRGRTLAPPAMASAMILAAGRGERMRPLTDTCPKPLLKVQGRALLDWHVAALAQAGFGNLVVNTAWLGEQIELHLEDFLKRAKKEQKKPFFDHQIGLQPKEYVQEQLSFSYSHEGRDFGRALETAGGIARALPLLGETFWVLAGDVYAPDFVFSQPAVQRFAASGQGAHLWLVPNPPHNVRGDFGLDTATGLATAQAALGQASYTYSTIGLYRRGFFDSLPWGNPEGIAAALAPLLRAAMQAGKVSAEVYRGRWTDVGTPERLAALNAMDTKA